MTTDTHTTDDSGAGLRLFSVTLRHLGTGLRWVVPVRAATADEARLKATDWPYANDGYVLDSLTDTGAA